MSFLNKACYGGAAIGIAALTTIINTTPPTIDTDEEDFNQLPGGMASSPGNPQADYNDPNSQDPNSQDPNFQDPGPGGNGTFNSNQANNITNRDNAPVGYCARGVANIAEQQNLGDFRGLNAHDFPSRMASQGYVLDTSYNQYNAPEGALLIYNSDTRAGKPARNSGGGLYGHVEYVSYSSSGSRQYSSSHTSARPGGSVNDNFMGAWVKKG